MPTVEVHGNLEEALATFKRKCKAAGTFTDCRSNKGYSSKSQKQHEAAKRREAGKKRGQSR